MEPYELLAAARRRTIGTKQTLKAVNAGRVKVVFVARDAQEHVVRDLISACEQKGVEIIYVDSMHKLGKACGIEVGASSAAILNS
ncbi:MAG TPA: 50S ribosomal protein L7Ae-like protein [Clostridia bacterium]|nr:50S ribosomal protein L7Ae-like protein [Clostridia bacterium]